MYSVIIVLYTLISFTKFKMRLHYEGQPKTIPLV